MCLEVGSALLCIKDILRSMYKNTQFPLFGPVHDYGFRFLDLLALMILAVAVWADFRTNGVSMSPLYWFVIIFFIVLIIIREILLPNFET